MQVTRSHKIELKVESQDAKTFFDKAFGVSRYTYNHVLAKANAYYTETGKCLNFNSYKKEFNNDKPEWMYDSPKDANQQPFAFVKAAFTNFFKGRAKHPRFKKKGGKESFYLSNDQVKLTSTHIRIPKLGLLRLKESPRFEGKIQSYTISKRAGRYFVSIAYLMDIEQPNRIDNSVGVDLGIKDLAILSTGEVIPNPKHLKKSLKRLKRLQRRVSKSVAGSQNRRKRIARLAKLHYKISNQRNDTIHKLTSNLTSRFGRIVIEDLNVKGMVKNHNLAQAISDCSFSEIRRQLEYKCILTNTELVIADRFYPSSRLCNCCGYKNTKLTLKDREWTCPSCSTKLDRDLNAAINLNKYKIGWATPEFKPEDSGVQDSEVISESSATGRSRKVKKYNLLARVKSRPTT